MERLIESFNKGDLVEAKKIFASLMADKVSAIMEEEKVAIAKSFMIEGEEVIEDDEESTKEE